MDNTARMAIAVQDDGGFYSFPLGVSAVPLNTMGGPDAVTIVEPLVGWGAWSYAVKINGAGIYFVSGDLPDDTPEVGGDGTCVVCDGRAGHHDPYAQCSDADILD